ncbi:MAG: hypothetical protein ACREBR_00230 [bacterium]
MKHTPTINRAFFTLQSERFNSSDMVFQAAYADDLEEIRAMLIEPAKTKTGGLM